MTPTIFAIDTAAERCSLAIARGTRMETWESEPGRTHLEHVLPMVSAFFAHCELRPADCDAFAFANGPGSFTGLRIACTVVQGLALAVERPVIPVSNLHALAIAALAGKVSDPHRVLAVVDARMQQAYWAVFESKAGVPTEVAPAALCDVEELPLLLEEWKPDLCAGERAFLDPQLAGWQGRVVDARADAAIIANIAGAKFARGETLAAQQAAPSYTRDRVAQTVAERQEAREARGP